MAWWSEYAARIEPDAALDKLTWFKLGGRAKWLFRPEGVDDLASMVGVHHARAGIPVLDRQQSATAVGAVRIEP